MIAYLEKRLALSNRGARDFLKGAGSNILLNIVLFLPSVFAFLFLADYIGTWIDPVDTGIKGIGFYIALGVVFMVITWAIARLQFRSTYTSVYQESADRRIALAEKLRRLPLAFFGEKNLSDLTATIMSDNADLEHTFSHAVPQLVASVVTICLMAAGLFFFNWQLSLALFWVVPVAAALIVLSKKWQRKNNTLVYDKKRIVTEKIQEGIVSIQEIKSCANEQQYLDGLDEALDDYEKHLAGGELLIGVLVNSAQSVLKLGMASTIIVGARLSAAGRIDLFTYLTFLIVASRIYEPVSAVFMNLAALFILDVRINRMNEMNQLAVQTGLIDFKPEGFDIVFEHVDFSYETGKQVMKDVSFTAKQGEITALVGPSGGGKSTATKLAARFWDVDSGRILLGDRNIQEIDPETLLQHYSMVFQDVVLFNATIMDNIRIGRRDATDEAVVQAAKFAQCDEFIRKMPDGYQTIIGENGETLSGGERQRISIARALLKNAPIVLLDEATASLDAENETKIQSGISALIKNKTVLIIAHRMRTVANADKIVVLGNGRVVESGNPGALKCQNGIFAKMVARQMPM